MQTRVRRQHGAILAIGVALSSCGGSKAAPATGTTTGATSTDAPTANACPHGMIAVPPGEFALAATKQSVKVAVHCLDRTEVTVSAYAACVKSGACTAPDAHDDEKHKSCNWQRAESDDHPINCVDHAQAVAFCTSLGKRLPTEAEWEWSARGNAAGTPFPWGGESLTGRACWDDDALQDSPTTTCPVGRFPTGATKSGIVDLVGNVWEWTSTPWKPGSPDMVDRGGGWLNSAQNMLTAGYRNHVAKTLRYSSLGFRCAK
jgi:formylglycine-generating enzyme required for sulfatase activity